MRFKLFAITVLVLIFAVTAFTQTITREEFQKSEWEMKSKYFQKLEERKNQSLLLDQADFDVKHWELDIDVTNIAGQIIYGKVTMTSEPVVDGLTEVDYDYNATMSADSVFMNGQPVDFSHSGDYLNITLDQTYNMGEPFTTVVYYHGHPPGSGFGSFGWDTHGGQPIISTLSEPEGAREWWPCKDIPHDKADSADIKITVPDNLIGTSNGVLISDTNNGNGTRTFHWHSSYPITTYLISLAISNYQEFTDWYYPVSGDSMPIVNYVYPEHFSQAVEDLNVVPPAIGIFAEIFGEYPFIEEKYGHSIFPWGGAMEHQCNTSYGSGLITGSHYYDWIAIHELAHMWFGDMISCDSWPNIWMNEGFASYLEALWVEELQGYNAYINYMRFDQNVNDPSGPIYDPDPLFSGNTVYNKGAWIVHMLRGIMGDEMFFDAMYGYANHPDYKYGTITTQQFQALMEQYYGGSMDWYFTPWLWGMNRPTYRHSWIAEDIGNGQYEVFMHIRQVQNYPAPELFTMPIKVYPNIGGVDTLITIWNDASIDDVRFIVNGEPTQIQFDKDFWILRVASPEPYTMNIVVTELPGGDVGVYYEETVEARGGTSPYTFAVTIGSLPDGLSLNETTGVISGTPSTEGIFTFTIEATDSQANPLTDDQEYSINIGDVVDIDEDQPEVPSDFALIGNYPNPFNATTIIKFRLNDPNHVTLDIYNLLGQKIETLYSGSMMSGEHELTWNGDNVPSGVYFYHLTAGDRSITKKMTLLK
jgi:hypothetical protein